MKVLELQQVSKRLGKFTLQDISLSIGKEYFILLGPTGAGKSVLIEIIAGIITPDTGSISLNGREITGLPPEKRHIGFLPQDYALFPHLSVMKNIEYGLRIKGKKNKFEVIEISKKLGIEHLLERHPENLSGGEKQRVALARALIVQPELLLLDEPLSAVDLKTKEKLMEELKRVHREFDVPVVHVTHSFLEAGILADRVAVIMEGKIMQIGKIRELLSDATSREVAEFVGVKDLFVELISQLE
jgi:molybdate/tungstate transport system ATP-binding protein